MVPIGLLIAGIYLLVGCIPFPSTQQYMINGNKVPKYLIGKKADSPIRLGETTIEKAMDVLAEHLAGRQYSGFLQDQSARSSSYIRQSFMELNGGRRYVIPYSRRSGYTIYPLCFMAEPITEQDFLSLEVDGRGIVVDFKTSHDADKVGLPADWRANRARWRSDYVVPATLPASRP